MPFVFCFYGKRVTGGYFIGTLGLLFGTIFLIESIFVVSKSETDDVQLTAFILLIGVVILIVPSIFLLYGTYKRSSRLLVVWLVLDVFAIMITLLDSLSNGLTYLILITAIDIYCWYFIFMLYKEFRAKESLLPINNSIPVNDLPPSYSEVPMTK